MLPSLARATAAVLCAATLLSTPAAAQPGRAALITRSADGAPIATAGAVWIGDRSVIAPALPLYGAARIRVELGGRSFDVQSIAVDGQESIAHLVLAEAPSGEPAVLGEGPALRNLGETYSCSDGSSARFVALYRLGTSDRAVLSLAAPGRGLSFYNKDNALVAFAGPPVMSSSPEKHELNASRAEVIRELVARKDFLVPVAEWTSAATPVDARAARLLLGSKTAAGLADAIRDAKASDPDWGRGLHPHLALTLLGPLTNERAWGICDDLIRYTSERELAPADRLRLEAAKAVCQGLRGLPGGAERLQDLIEHGLPGSAYDGQQMGPYLELLLAGVMLKQGDQRARRQFTEAVRATLADPRPWQGLLQIAAAEDAQEAFVKIARELLRRDWRVESAVQVARQLTDWKRWPEAEEFLDQAAARWPDSIDPVTAQAQLLAARGRAAEAVEITRGLVAKRPDSGVALQALFEALAAAGDQTELLEVAGRWRARAPSPSAYLVPAQWLISHGKFDEALGLIAEGAPEHGKAGAYAYLHAGLLSRAGRKDEALAVAQSAAESDPSSTHGWLAIASLRSDAGEWAECAAACERVLAFDAANGPALKMAAEAYARLGNRKRLEAVRAEIEALQPEGPGEARR